MTTAVLLLIAFAAGVMVGALGILVFCVLLYAIRERRNDIRRRMKSPLNTRAFGAHGNA